MKLRSNAKVQRLSLWISSAQISSTLHISLLLSPHCWIKLWNIYKKPPKWRFAQFIVFVLHICILRPADGVFRMSMRRKTAACRPAFRARRAAVRRGENWVTSPQIASAASHLAMIVINEWDASSGAPQHGNVSPSLFYMQLNWCSAVRWTAATPRPEI